ncbi:hypothetical protein BD779DRAFT_677144 [Infundibulicybe gibba]|nr:hypothetical protein BD779DRAFT_677144 [Infundibulicybe gibba]
MEEGIGRLSYERWISTVWRLCCFFYLVWSVTFFGAPPVGDYTITVDIERSMLAYPGFSSGKTLSGTVGTVLWIRIHFAWGVLQYTANVRRPWLFSITSAVVLGLIAFPAREILIRTLKTDTQVFQKAASQQTPLVSLAPLLLRLTYLDSRVKLNRSRSM